MATRISLIVAIAYSVLITILSLIHLGTISIGDFNPTDKMMHCSAYFGMGFVWILYYFLKMPSEKITVKGILKVCALVIAFGMLIEVLQGTLTDYRTPDWFDILANSTGVFIAFLVSLIFKGNLTSLKHKINLFL